MVNDGPVWYPILEKLHAGGLTGFSSRDILKSVEKEIAMLYLTREDSLELLPLSARSSNCLRRAGIHTVGQLLDYPADKWLDIRNLGQKSADELTSLAARIRAGDGFQMVASKPKPLEPPAAAPPAGYPN